jgi:hypothetical protein
MEFVRPLTTAIRTIALTSALIFGSLSAFAEEPDVYKIDPEAIAFELGFCETTANEQMKFSSDTPAADTRNALQLFRQNVRIGSNMTAAYEHGRSGAHQLWTAMTATRGSNLQKETPSLAALRNKILGDCATQFISITKRFSK